MEKKDLNNKNIVLAHLTEKEKDQLADLSRIRVYPKNSFLFWQDERVTNGFLVIKGLVKLYRSHASGRIRTLALKNGFDLISHFSLVFPYDHLCTAQLLSKATVLCFPVEELMEIARFNEEFQNALRQAVNNTFKSSLMEVENRIFLNINGCLASKLIELAEKFGIARREGTVINLRLTHRQLADMIGTNRETVCKELLFLKKSKAIVVNDNLITIINRKKLAIGM